MIILLLFPSLLCDGRVLLEHIVRNKFSFKNESPEIMALTSLINNENLFISLETEFGVLRIGSFCYSENQDVRNSPKNAPHILAESPYHPLFAFE